LISCTHIKLAHVESYRAIGQKKKQDLTRIKNLNSQSNLHRPGRCKLVNPQLLKGLLPPGMENPKSISEENHADRKNATLIRRGGCTIAHRP